MMTQTVISSGLHLTGTTGKSQQQKLFASKESFGDVMDLASNQSTSANKEPMAPKSQSNVDKQSRAFMKKIGDDLEPNKVMSQISNQEEEVYTEETMANIKKLEVEIIAGIKNAIGLSDEELENIMAELGMQTLDLLQVDNLKLFLMKINDTTDVSDVLMNEELSNQFTQLKSIINQIMKASEFEFDDNEFDEFMTFLKAGMEVMIANLESEMKTTSIAEETEDVQKLDVDATSQKEQGTTIMVEKEGFQNTSSEDFLNRSQDSNSDDAITLFSQNLTNAVNNGTGEVGNLMEVQQMKEIVEQVVEQIKIVLKPDSTSMEIQLNPEELGKVNLSVISKDGQLTARFVAENQIAKEAIESNIQILRENFNNQGIKVETIEVTVSNFGFEQSNQREDGRQDKKGNSRRINLEDADFNHSSLTDEEVLAVSIMETNGGSVDYTA